MRNRRSFHAGPANERALLLALSVGALAACGAGDRPQDHDRGESVVGPAAGSVGVVASRDDDGTAKFVWAGKTSAAVTIAGKPSEAARAHLVHNAALLGISEKLVRSAILSTEHTLEGGGSVHSFTQKLDGIQVYRTRASVILDGNNNLVAISGNLRAAAGSSAKVGRFLMTPEQALVRAYADRFGVTLSESAIRDVGAESNGEYRAYRVTTPADAPRLAETARVRKIYMPEKGRLVAAYHAEFIARAKGSKDNDGWLYAIAADTGRTLIRDSITAHDKFTYRVWAESGQHNIPMDGPLLRQAPLAGNVKPDVKETGAAGTVLVSVEGFNKNPAGGADPWLPPTATESKGNNVDAYSDRNGAANGTGDGFDVGIDYRADVTSSKTFDRLYNLTMQPDGSVDQIKASVTQIFYVTNWLHDYWYDSGFDEKSGNAQASNYGRGGKEGDALHAEAQDGADVGSKDNANMSSYSDGRSPRMQMYVWSGTPNSSLKAVPAIVFDDQTGTAIFGPATFNTTGSAVLSTPADGCTAITGVTGMIAVIDRGNCNFTVKVDNAQAAGAIGVVLVNNTAGHIAPAPNVDDPTVTIPFLGVSLEDGAKLKAKLGAGPVSLTLTRGAEILRDGTIDNTVVAHEWGHYLHHRLVQCGSKSCGGMSEGWADFDALMMVIKDSDPLDSGTVFPLAQYAAANPYFGIRRAPYAADFTKNPFTFKHIRKASTLPTGAPLSAAAADMTEIHNVGEIWAQTLFEGYTNLLRETKGASPRFTFDQAKRRMADYIVAGMKATPPEPTFVEQRDALLAVAFARDAKDFIALARGFAKRGLGVGAVAPPVSSKDLNEAVEESSVKGNLAYLDSKVDDAVRSCDRDGFLDADEKGDVTIRVRNAGWVTLKGSVATVTTTTPGITLGNGGKGTIVSVDPFGVVKVRIGIGYDAAATKKVFVPVTVTLTNPDSFSASVTGKIEPLVNFEIAENTSAIDNVESPKTAWTLAHAGTTTDTWARAILSDAAGKPLSPPDFHWHGADNASRTDESLVSPALTVSTTAPFQITFKHKYSFEHGPDAPGNPDVYFDGGVIEYSADNGVTWIDVATIADPGYTQTFYVPAPPSPNPADEDSPLSGRRGFAGVLAAWTPVTVDLGTALAGKTVKVRFRVGTDGGTSDLGWDIDDLGFAGITNKPFATLVDDAVVCKDVPIAKAGDPQTVLPEAVVKLDGSGSSSPASKPITFVWEQLDGTGVKLATPETPSSTFTAPKVTEETKLLFRVTVADAKQAASDTVEIIVRPASANPDGGTDGGGPGGPTDLGNAGNQASSLDHPCLCTQVGAPRSAGFGALGAMLAGALALAFRKRRRPFEGQTRAITGSST